MHYIYRKAIFRIGDMEVERTFHHADNNSKPMELMSEVMKDLGERKVPWRATPDRIYWVEDGIECEVILIGD